MTATRSAKKLASCIHFMGSAGPLHILTGQYARDGDAAIAQKREQLRKRYGNKTA